LRLVTFSGPAGHAPRLGVLDGERVLDVTATGAGLPSSMIELIRGGEEALAALAAVAAEPDLPTLALAEARLHAPIPRPGKIVGVGLNYSEHVAESARTLDTEKNLPQRPVLFDKPATAVIGPEGEILHDGTLTSQLDWECELAVVIGPAARRVKAADAYKHVFGYSIINDVSARDQRRSGQWFFSKGQDSYAPFGPCIVTAEDISDPQELELGLTVNGDVKQDSSTRFMLFSIAELIEDISSGMTLEPGDVIATGSPSGVGAGMDPPQFLQPGDVVEATVEGIGTLRNRVIDARPEGAR
jgi:2-keto-4-pentenoate hydratase/2-oxohepta-3-ene-1,7-dioic acid hydratase in catechol pathway